MPASAHAPPETISMPRTTEKGHGVFRPSRSSRRLASPWRSRQLCHLAATCDQKRHPRLRRAAGGRRRERPPICRLLCYILHEGWLHAGIAAMDTDPSREFYQGARAFKAVRCDILRSGRRRAAHRIQGTRRDSRRAGRVLNARQSVCQSSVVCHFYSCISRANCSAIRASMVAPSWSLMRSTTACCVRTSSARPSS
jgi:hypothetical protein